MQYTLEKKTISIREASECYGLSKASIYRYIESGKINPTKLGRRTFLAVKELDSLFLGEHATWTKIAKGDKKGDKYLINRKKYNVFNALFVSDGAAEKTRTSTGFTPQRPQRCASTIPPRPHIKVWSVYLRPSCLWRQFMSFCIF